MLLTTYEQAIKGGAVYHKGTMSFRTSYLLLTTCYYEANASGRLRRHWHECAAQATKVFPILTLYGYISAALQSLKHGDGLIVEIDLILFVEQHQSLALRIKPDLSCNLDKIELTY